MFLEGCGIIPTNIWWDLVLIAAHFGAIPGTFWRILNASGGDSTTSLSLGSYPELRDFCSETRSRNACRSPKQGPRNPAILRFLHKIRQIVPGIAPKCAAMSPKSHQMLVGMIPQHPRNILGRAKHFAIPIKPQVGSSVYLSSII